MNLVITGKVEQVALLTQQQLKYRFPPFPTVMEGVTNRIVTFSDIHGDLDALIVCLRDCANVIYKPGFNPSTGQRDPDLVRYFEMDINSDQYDRSLGYRWRHDDTSFVVIIGDLIDAVRVRPANKNDKTKDKIIEKIYYKQIELKILHFINAMNESALRRYEQRHPHDGAQIELPDHNCGRIYKLLGNHDLFNFLGYKPGFFNNFVRAYSFPEDIPSKVDKTEDKVYYHSDTKPISDDEKEWETYYIKQQGFYTYTRDTIFNYTHPGFNAYFETTGTGVALLINDNLFVHGGLYGQLTMNDVIHFNHELLQSKSNLLSPDLFTTLCRNISPLLEVRHYAEHNDDTDIPSVQGKLLEGKVSCASFADKLVQFCGQDGCPGINPRRIRMFKGHCSQSLANFNPSTVLSGFIMNTGTTEIYSNYDTDDQIHPNAFYHGPQTEAVDEKDEDDLERYHPHNRKWGVTLSCDRNTNRALNLAGQPSPQIIKVDVGMGRGQDYETANSVFNIPGISEKTLFESRVPQVIIIPEVGHDNPERLILIRSTLKNMATHMPRPIYSAAKQQVLRDLVGYPNPIIEARARRSVYGRKKRRGKKSGGKRKKF